MSVVFQDREILQALAQACEQALVQTARTILLPAFKRTLSQPPATRKEEKIVGLPPRRTTDEEHQKALPGLKHLFESFRVESSPVLGVSILSDNIYGMYLEIGTRDMRSRPWLHPTMADPAVQKDFAQTFLTIVQHLLPDDPQAKS